MRAKTIRYPFLWKGAYVLSRLPDSLAHCLQVQRQKANMKTGFSLQWPLLAQFSQDELWSSHPLCITADKEIIAMLFMPMHWLFKTKVHGNTLTRKCRRVKVSGNRFEQFYFGGSPQLLLKFSIVIGSTRAYLSRNRRAITWGSNYRCFFKSDTCNWIPTWFSRQLRGL